MTELGLKSTMGEHYVSVVLLIQIFYVQYPTMDKITIL